MSQREKAARRSGKQRKQQTSLFHHRALGFSHFAHGKRRGSRSAMAAQLLVRHTRPQPRGSLFRGSFPRSSLSPTSALSKVAANMELVVGLLLLKQFVKKHWQEGEDSFEPPVVSSNEKESIRRMLLLALDDPHKKICTAIGMAVASIAMHDWPELWPDLLPFLLNLINNQTNMNGVHGAMRCLVLLSADLDDKMVPTLIPALFPSLLTIVSCPQIYDPYIQTKALSIIYSCTSMLGTVSGVYKAETSSLIVPMLKPWMDQFSSILQIPVQSENPNDWSIKIEVLKCLNQFIQNFSSLFKSEFEVILGPLWSTFVSSLSVYEKASIEGTEDSHEGRYDSDGSEKNLDSFVIQLFEFMLTIVGSPRLGKVVVANIRELVYYTIAFLQMTQQQVLTWSVDANQFIADEEDATYSCRFSGVLLLEEVVNSFDGEGILAIIDGANQWFTESQIRKAAGNASWWRIREATIFALSSLSEQLFETQETGFDTSSLKHLVEQIFTEDSLLDPLEYPFLYARIFTSIAKFSSLISNSLLEQFLYLAMKAITMDVPPPVKVGACRALTNLLPEAKKEIVQSQLLGLFSSLTNLLNHASDETLHMVLDTLLAAVKAGHESSTLVEHMVSPVILNLWASHVSDPFISIDALEVLEAIKSIPGCVHPLVSRILPSIGPILNKPQEQADGLVAGSLDLNAPADVVKAIYDVSFNAVINIILQSDDHSEIQKKPPESNVHADDSIGGNKGNAMQGSNRWRTLEMPIFEGEDPMGWLTKIESDGCYGRRSSRVVPMRGILEPKPFLGRVQDHNLPKALLALEQEETVQEFIGQFEKHVGMVKGLEEPFLVEVFLKGLKEEISTEVRLHEPKNLMESMVKARRVEDKNRVLGKTTRPEIGKLWMAVHIQDLVAALVKRMQSAQNCILLSSLLIVFARLVHMSVPNVGQFIDLLISIPAEGHCNSFAYVMSEWTKQQGEIMGAYQIKVTTSALALLLTSRHNELAKIYVQGHLIKSHEGITTRSKAKSAPDQWVMLPLPTKIVALLADALTEIQEQVLAADDEDSDWEEVQADGIENDKEFLYSVSTSSGKATDEQLEAMVKVFNEDQDDQYVDGLLSVADPLNQINLANYLVDFFVSFSQSDRQFLDHICKSLSQSQRNAIQLVGESVCSSERYSLSAAVFPLYVFGILVSRLSKHANGEVSLAELNSTAISLNKEREELYNFISFIHFYRFQLIIKNVSGKTYVNVNSFKYPSEILIDESITQKIINTFF
ncbi:Importin-9 [Glycine soja]